MTDTHPGNKNERISPSGSNSFISVIIPVFNDPDGIRDTLDSLVDQDYNADRYEIIVADNGSKDNTRDVITEYTETYPHLIRLVVENTIQSSYAARNKGVLSSEGSIIAFIDADMSVDKDFLSKIDRSFISDRWDYLACAVEIYLKHGTVSEMHNKIFGFPIQSYMNKDHYTPTCCLVVRRTVFEKVGLFDSRLISSGDREFGNRVYESGQKFCYNPDIVIRHPARSSYRDLFFKLFRIGRGLEQLAFYYPERYPRWNRLLNPLSYLPQIPCKLFIPPDRFAIWKDLSFDYKITIFFIKWYNKLALRSGSLYEKLKRITA